MLCCFQCCAVRRKIVLHYFVLALRLCASFTGAAKNLHVCFPRAPTFQTEGIIPLGVSLWREWRISGGGDSLGRQLQEAGPPGDPAFLLDASRGNKSCLPQSRVLVSEGTQEANAFVTRLTF